MRIATLLVGFLGIALLGAPSAHADAPGSVATSARKSSKKSKRRRKRARVPVFSGRLASAAELRDDAPPRPSGHLELRAVNFHETLSVDLYNPDGSFNEDALDQLNHLWRCRRTGTEKAIEPRLFEMLSRIYDHFGRPIELVSGFRNQEHITSYHFHGFASDIRISGVSDKALHKFVATLDAGGMGIGLYPKAGFIHVDMRPEPSYRWVDYSPPGSSDKARSHRKKKRKTKKRPTYANS